MSLPVENLLTPDYLRRVAWHPPAEVTAESIGAALTALGARPWQVAATAQVIADAFVAPPQTAEDPSEAGS
jgi:ribonuclease D